MAAPTKVATVEADGVKVFYRYAGPDDAPVIVLLHGFPTSSHQFRNLIPLLAKQYRVLAPDLPGFGFTEVPEERKYDYTFANLAKTFGAWTDALKLTRFAVYIFDYGAPTALRFALDRPNAVAAILTQNGNAYTEGLGADFWAPVKKLWETHSEEDKKAVRGIFEFDITKWQYTVGSPHPDLVQPEAYYLDQALMDRPGNKDIQLNLVNDYSTNVPLYPKFHEYFRTSDVPVLAVWGKNDPCFIPPGAEAYKKDVKKFELHWLDAGHFALETNEVEMAGYITAFLEKYEVFKK